jgi:hypothetical protein
MNEVLFSDSEIEELVLILQISAYDADVAIGQSHDVEALHKHKQTVIKWLIRFQQLKVDRASQEIGTLKYGYEEQIRGLPPMPAPPDAQE